MRYLAAFLLFPSLAWAGDVVVCDPTNATVPNAVTSYQKGVDSSTIPNINGYLLWQAPNDSMSAPLKSQMNLLRSQIDSLSGISVRYWKCTDLDLNGILDGVTEMTQTEKNFIDAPIIAEQARVQLSIAEKSSNDVCNADPSDLDSRIDAAYAAAGTAAQVKSVTAAIIKKLARCLWARTAVN